MLGAYYYPGWHPCPVRDAGFPQGWSEWDLIYDVKPRFEGHEQPLLPAWGRERDDDPTVFSRKITTAQAHGINLFVFAFFWSREKQLLQGALNRGFLGCSAHESMNFALMWANRMPRHVLPVKSQQAQLIDPTRLVYTDRTDFLAFIRFLGEHYFPRKNYFRFQGGLYLSIFDTSFFLRQLGAEEAKRTVAEARAWLLQQGLGQLHLAAIDPIPEFQPHLKDIGFDSVTHYVFLPDWKGDFRQDYLAAAREKMKLWNSYSPATGLPYFPSVSPGWDASARGVDFGKEKPRRYPWWPIVVNREPRLFGKVLKAAVDFASGSGVAPLTLISSWNEWSEGHYLEPDQKYGLQWLEAVKQTHGS